jgi:hypothetical protein
VFLTLAVVLALPAVAHSAPLKLSQLVKAEDKICERKPDGVYCGRGLKRKHLFRCVGGAIETTYLCDFGCDAKAQSCAKRRPRAGAAAETAAPRTDCHYSGQIRRGEQAGATCK